MECRRSVPPPGEWSCSVVWYGSRYFCMFYQMPTGWTDYGWGVVCWYILSSVYKSHFISFILLFLSRWIDLTRFFFFILCFCFVLPRVAMWWDHDRFFVMVIPKNLNLFTWHVCYVSYMNYWASAQSGLVYTIPRPTAWWSSLARH